MIDEMNPVIKADPKVFKGLRDSSGPFKYSLILENNPRLRPKKGPKAITVAP
jgi:hypothetical protein